MDRLHQTVTHGGPGLALLRKYGETQLRAILDALPEGIVLVDGGKVIRFVNPATERLLDRPSKELLGQAFTLPLDSGRTTETAPSATWALVRISPSARQTTPAPAGAPAEEPRPWLRTSTVIPASRAASEDAAAATGSASIALINPAAGAARPP